MWSVRFACLLLLSLLMMSSVTAVNRMTVDHNNTATTDTSKDTSADTSKDTSSDTAPAKAVKDAVDPPDLPVPLAMPVAILPEENDETPTDTSTVVKDVFQPIGTAEPVVDVLIQKFLAIYRAEVARTSLDANIVNIIKAERTNVREEMQEREVDADGLGMDFVEEAQTQQYRIYLLLQYHFKSAMLAAKRPYVSVLRVTMDCYNTTTQEDTEHELDEDVDPDAVDLSCDILDHMDLPRRNGSSAMVPQFLQRQIFHSAPESYVSNHTLSVIYDAVEAQDMSLDENDQPIFGQDTMHYVRFRVKGGNAEDCMVVVEHAGDVNTLRYQDTVCYEGAEALAAEIAAMKATSFQLTKANLPIFIVIASIAGALVAILLIYRQRTKQRSGYSYLHSNNSKLTHVPTQSTNNTDVAIAC